MKKRLTLALASLLSALFAQHALAAQDCAEKKASIQHQLDYARQHHNQQRVAGLEKALSEVDTHCSPESLRKDARHNLHKVEGKLAEKQRDLKEAQRDYQAAKQKNDFKKMEKYRKKVHEKQLDAQKLRDELHQAKQDAQRFNS